MGWRPRFNPSGTKLTSERDGYWQAQWLNDEIEIAHNGSVLVIGGQPTAIPAGNVIAAGGGKWATCVTAEERIETSWGETIHGAADPVLSPNGQWFAYVTNPHGMQKDLVLNGRTILRQAPISEVRCSNSVLAWKEGAKVFGVRLETGEVVDLSLGGPEGWPVPIDTPDGPWVLTLRALGVALRPFGETHGYRVDNDGQTYYPDAVFVNGHIKVAFTNDHGVDGLTWIRLTAPCVDLTVPPEPPPPPPPPPEPPQMPDTYRGLTDAQLTTLRRERNKYGEVVTPTEIGAILNATAWAHRHEGVGLQKKQGSATTQPSTGIPIWNGLRFLENGVHVGQDVLAGASIGRATPYKGYADTADATGPNGRLEAVLPPDAPPEPAPDPPPDPSAPDVRALIAKVESLASDLAFLKNTVQDLQERSLPANMAKKGDPIVVTGLLSVFGLTRTITSRGTL